MSTDPATPSGHETRSATTRSRLIDAAIEVISAVGYEGASTRTLARTAHTALSAIPYHFGGKKELYLAAAQMIAEYAANRFVEAVAVLDADDDMDRAIRFEQALTDLMHMMLNDVELQTWAPFIARCAYDNDDAFALIYDQAIAPVLERLVLTASKLSGRSPDDEVLRLRISAIATAIISFRFLRGIMLRGLAGNEFHSGSISQIEDMIRILCRSEFLALHHIQ